MNAASATSAYVLGRLLLEHSSVTEDAQGCNQIPVQVESLESLLAKRCHPYQIGLMLHLRRVGAGTLWPRVASTHCC